MSVPERPGLAGIFISSFQKAGYGPTAALRALREAGGTVRTQTWYRAWAQALDGLDRAVRVQRAPINRRPIADEIGAGSWRTTQRYSYQVSVTVRNRDSGDVYELAHPFTVLSDSPITYSTALDLAGELANEQLDAYGEEAISASISSVWDREQW